MEDQITGSSIKAEFLKRRMRYWAAMPLMFIGMAFLIAIDRVPGPETVFGVPLVIAKWVPYVAFLFYGGICLVVWRCPACRRLLGKSINPHACRKCGVELR